MSSLPYPTNPLLCLVSHTLRTPCYVCSLPYPKNPLCLHFLPPPMHKHWQIHLQHPHVTAVVNGSIILYLANLVYIKIGFLFSFLLFLSVHARTWIGTLGNHESYDHNVQINWLVELEHDMGDWPLHMLERCVHTSVCLLIFCVTISVSSSRRDALDTVLWCNRYRDLRGHRLWQVIVTHMTNIVLAGQPNSPVPLCCLCLHVIHSWY